MYPNQRKALQALRLATGGDPAARADIRDISRSTEIGTDSLRAIFRELSEDGFVEDRSIWKYSITSEGLRELDET